LRWRPSRASTTRAAFFFLFSLIGTSTSTSTSKRRGEGERGTTSHEHRTQTRAHRHGHGHGHAPTHEHTHRHRRTHHNTLCRSASTIFGECSSSTLPSWTQSPRAAQSHQLASELISAGNLRGNRRRLPSSAYGPGCLPEAPSPRAPPTPSTPPTPPTPPPTPPSSPNPRDKESAGTRCSTMTMTVTMTVTELEVCLRSAQPPAWSASMAVTEIGEV